MNFFTISKKIKCQPPAEEVLKALLRTLLTNNELKADISDISPDGITFQVKSSNFLVRNSFRPTVHVEIKNSELSTSGKIEYSLSKGTRMIFLLLFSAALSLECLLLFLFFMNQLASPLFLLLPVGFICILCLLSILGLRISSRYIHHQLLAIVNAWDSKAGDGLREP